MVENFNCGMIVGTPYMWHKVLDVVEIYKIIRSKVSKIFEIISGNILHRARLSEIAVHFC